MSLRPYIKVNPNELPSGYLTRVQAAGSHGGAKITHNEAQEGYVLLQTWQWEKFKRLTTLPTQQLAREVRAIREMEKIPNPNQNFNTPLPLAMSSNTFLGFALSLCFSGIGFGLALITFNLKSQKMTNQSQLIDTLETRLKDLDAKKAKGEITQADYERERRKIIEEVIKAHSP